MAKSSRFVSPLMGIQKDWIDYNGHLNMAFYNVLFDRGVDGGLEQLGIGPNYLKDRGHTIFTAEAHVRYVRELHLDHQVTASFHIVDHDEKRLHIFQELRHSDGWLSATSETLALHINMKGEDGPKVAPFPTDIMKNVEAMAAEHARLPYPQDAGRRIEIRRKTA
ncbi:MAG: thioesterase family protein [Pseudomonadota bacterium]